MIDVTSEMEQIVSNQALCPMTATPSSYYVFWWFVIHLSCFYCTASSGMTSDCSGAENTTNRLTAGHVWR